ncbi:MAG: DNA polymerase III subunit beta [Candidatus Omnitrophica bacterium 4484_70.1]|nr:MAG: DNA polymerase III subunit beta [Candidatus Omnitrophica bacterium 4484_70.1]
MKFIINQSSLLEALHRISGPVGEKQNFPILNCILVKAEKKDKIKLISTNLEITLITRLEGSIEEEGVTAIPFKRFISIVRELPKQEIVIEIRKDNLFIKSEKIEFRINCMNPEEFPQIEESIEESLIKLSTSDLLEMIKMTSFCVGREDLSYIFSGILFEILEDKINLVATDGKRLSFIQRQLPSTQPLITEKIKFILPIKSVYELQKIIKEKKEDVFLFIKGNDIGFDIKDTILITKTIEGDFPDYSQYIPQPTQNVLILRKDDFLSSLKRAQILSIPEYQGVRLNMQKTQMSILKSTPQLGELKEVIGVNYTGTPLEISFNPNYLIDVLKNIEDENVKFEIYGADKPAVLRKEGFVYLVLPIKI